MRSPTPATPRGSRRSLLGGKALAEELRGQLVQPLSPLLSRCMKLAHQVGVKLHGEWNESHLALALPLVPFVQHRGGALAKSVGSRAGAGQLAALQLLEVCFLHGVGPVVS